MIPIKEKKRLGNWDLRSNASIWSLITLSQQQILIGSSKTYLHDSCSRVDSFAPIHSMILKNSHRSACGEFNLGGSLFKKSARFLCNSFNGATEFVTASDYPQVMGLKKVQTWSDYVQEIGKINHKFIP